MNTQIIKDSFLNLLKIKSYSSISIQEIANHAGIARRTFYQYYENKQQVYEEILGDFIEWSLKPFEKNKENQQFSSKIEQFTFTIIENLDMVERLFQIDCPDVLTKVIENILISQIQKGKTGFFLGKLSSKAAQDYYVVTISQNCTSSIRYVLKNKDLDKEKLIQGLCEASDMISHFYQTTN